jgi:benzoylformate decarboxylase
MATADPQSRNGAPMADAKGQATWWGRDYVFDILKELGIHHIFGVSGTNDVAASNSVKGLL